MRFSAVALLAVIAVTDPAHAQTPARTPLARPGSIAVVISDAPIMLLPDANRIPLRTAARGTSLEVVQDGPEWVQVRFNDPDLGVRQGYVQAKYVQRENPLQPIDLSVPGSKPGTAAAPTVRAGEQEQRGIPSRPTDTPGRSPMPRRGGWFSAGLGFGSLTCELCEDSYWGGFSGGLAGGVTVNGHLLIGAGTTGWSRTIEGLTVTAGTFDFRVRAYPSLYHGFFVNGGIGLGHISVGDSSLTISDNGIGIMFGVGWDIKTGRNVSVTPFWNGSGISALGQSYGFGQIGVGLTIH